jgi:hypothetical protein
MIRLTVYIALIVVMTALATVVITGAELPRPVREVVGYPRINLGVDLQGGVRFRIRVTDVKKSTPLLRNLWEAQDNMCHTFVQLHTYQGALSLLDLPGARPQDKEASCVKSQMTERWDGAELAGVQFFDFESGMLAARRILLGALVFSLLVTLLCFVRYRWHGFAGLAALLFFAAMTVWLLGVVQVELTLPGLGAVVVVLGLVGLLVCPLLGRARRQTEPDEGEPGPPPWRSLFVRSWIVLMLICAAVCLLVPGWWGLGTPVAVGLIAATATFLTTRWLAVAGAAQLRFKRAGNSPE